MRRHAYRGGVFVSGTAGSDPVSDSTMRRPTDVTLTALYYAGFSAVLIFVLLWQLLIHGTRERWFDALFAVLFFFALSLVPTVISLGLWTLDNAARLGSIMFAFLHVIVTCAHLTHLPSSRYSLPITRIGIDVLIIVAMVRPGVHRAFKCQSIELGLGLKNPR